MQSKINLVSVCIAFLIATLGGCAATPTENTTAMADGQSAIDSPTATLVVHGMSCPLCANNVDKQLLTVPGVRSVDVDMGTGQVRVGFAPNASVTKAQLADAVDKSGFSLTEVRVP